MPAMLLEAGITTAQFIARLQDGIAPSADLICFTVEYLVVPDDPNLSVSVGAPTDENGLPWLDGHAPNHAQGQAARLGARCDAGEGREGGQGHGPFGLGAADVAWYRLPATRSLATADPGRNTCGTTATGWLSGWVGELPCARDCELGQWEWYQDTVRCGDRCGPSHDYTTPADGSLPPPVGHPPAAGTVCFNNQFGSAGNSDQTCQIPTQIYAVDCGGFSLWELPPLGGCCYGYCLSE
eukprot:SAG31_NODE_4503_length_3181_cov_3.463660_2_plen_239_part_00